MAIEAPTTYAEWFWSNSLEATYARAASYEKTLAPFVGDVAASVAMVEGMPSYMKRLLDAMQAPPAPDFDSSIVRFIAELGAGLGQRILGHEIKEFDYRMNHYLRNVRITDTVANQLRLRKKITEDFWKERNLDVGYSEAEMIFNYLVQKPYPSLPDIITWARYHGEPYNPKELVWSKYDISPDDWDLWEWLTRQKLNTEQVQSLYTRKFMNEYEATTELMRLGWRDDDMKAALDLAYQVPNAMLLVQGSLVTDTDEATITELISKAGIHPNYSKEYIDGILTKPASIDIVAYELRRDPSLTNLDTELKRIGIHPNYHDLYKELAYQIPPVADIITMAVREAFTPEIAARFGQYEDLPTPYVEWVQKKGLSREWAERYWAAHWSLPSSQQGFEMLHRGVITVGDLHLLLRALDVMPFWRDKLIEIAYTPLTRVDVRRMYALGVIDEDGVKRAYRDLGYNEYNATLMTQFTIKWTERAAERAEAIRKRAAMIKVATWTTAQTLSFLKKQLITEDRAKQELTILGYDEERTNTYLSSVKPSP